MPLNPCSLLLVLTNAMVNTFLQMGLQHCIHIFAFRLHFLSVFGIHRINCKSAVIGIDVCYGVDTTFSHMLLFIRLPFPVAKSRKSRKKAETILVYRRAYLLCYCHTLALVTLFFLINLQTSPGVTQDQFQLVWAPNFERGIHKIAKGMVKTLKTSDFV